MKLFLAVLALVACVAGEEWIPKTVDQLKQVGRECIKEYPITPEQLDKLIQNEISNETAVHKYQLCAAVKLGVYSHDHGYYTERLAKQFNYGLAEEDVKKIYDDCVHQGETAGKSDDVIVFEHHRCFMKGISEKKQEIEKK